MGRKKWIIIALIALGISGYIIWNATAEKDRNAGQSEVYMDIWRDNSLDMDIALYSIGSGEDEMIYLGAQPTHYLVHPDGKVYTSVAASFKKKTTGEINGPVVVELTTLTEEQLESLEKELKEAIRVNGNDPDAETPFWNVKIGDEVKKVYVDVYTEILKKYIGE